jgi:hypothetical protein
MRTAQYRLPQSKEEKYHLTIIWHDTGGNQTRKGFSTRQGRDNEFARITKKGVSIMHPTTYKFTTNYTVTKK